VRIHLRNSLAQRSLVRLAAYEFLPGLFRNSAGHLSLARWIYSEFLAICRATRALSALLGCATAFSFLVPLSGWAQPQGMTDCASCHQDISEAYGLGVHGQAVKNGNAGAPDCAMCHADAHNDAKTAWRPSSSEFRKAVPDTCGMCHNEIAEQFKVSVHGKAVDQGIRQAPICTDCHGEHNIISPKNINSPVNAANIRETCANCHGNVKLTRRFGLPADRITSFDSSFHGLAAKSGSQTVANCASCHGVHNILPSSDEKSTINAKNLPATCGKCHAGAGSRFSIGTIHIAEGKQEPEGMKLVRLTYLFLIPGVIGFMLIHNGADWMRKWHMLRIKGIPHSSMQAPHGEGELRMLPMEQLQHGLLAISFIVLAWTGFALKYPDEWWARPLLLWETTKSVRGVVHRVAAVVFMGVTVMHLMTLIFSSKLRHHWTEMLPRVQDSRQAVLNLFYLLRLRKKKPALASHSYIEKMEYWAVVWGAIVMILTGLLLWGNSLALRYIPKSWLDILNSIHFYEALLATLAIVVWHFYFVIFDPEVYPMDTAWLTGKSIRKRGND
jgi:cytochrome b subunit of formate dehydrogenase